MMLGQIKSHRAGNQACQGATVRDTHIAFPLSGRSFCEAVLHDAALQHLVTRMNCCLCRALEQAFPGVLDVMAMFAHPQSHTWQALAWKFLDTCVGRTARRPELEHNQPAPPYCVKPPTPSSACKCALLGGGTSVLAAGAGKAGPIRWVSGVEHSWLGQHESGFVCHRPMWHGRIAEAWEAAVPGHVSKLIMQGSQRSLQPPSRAVLAIKWHALVSMQSASGPEQGLLL